MANGGKSTVFRVTGLPITQTDTELAAKLTSVIDSNFQNEERSQISVKIALVPSCQNEGEAWVALVDFVGGVPQFLSHLVMNPLGDWQVEMDDVDINFDRHFFGFTQLYAPEPGKAVIADIIAITGLDGHAYGSWRGKGNLGRMWLRDFFSKDLPHCRTMVYGYNSKLSSRGIDTILDYGREFMEEIKKVRFTTELRERPLFFIAHSFGGIILAHCLVKAVQASEDDHPTVPSLYKATYSIFFFATPHKGLVVEDIKTMLAEGQSHLRHALLEEINQTSNLLVYQLADFKNLVRDRKIVSFFETEQTRKLEWNIETQRWGRSGEYMTAVEKDSAILQLPDTMEDKIPLHADHSQIVKFDSRSAPGYRSVLEKLRQFEQDAPKAVAARFCRRLSDWRVSGDDANALQWLSSLDFVNKQVDTISRRSTNTCLWLLANSVFTQWIDSDASNRLLWCPGEPGAGKTVAASVVIEHLSALCVTDRQAIVAYLYCDYNAQVEQNAVAMLGSLIRQIAVAASVLPPWLAEAYRKSLKSQTKLHADWALELLTKSCLGLSKAYIVIDALDEVSNQTNTREELLDKILKLQAACPSVRVFITSRSHLRDINDTLQNAAKILLRATDGDLKSFVAARLAKSPELQDFLLDDPAMEEKIISTIVSRANGQFLLPKLHLDRLSEMTCLGELEEALYDIATSIEDTYKQTLTRLGGHSKQRREVAIQTLLWLSHSVRPLSFRELQTALSVRHGLKTVDPKYFRSKKLILETCLGLVTVEEESDEVRLLHFTLKDFLKSQSALFGDPDSSIAEVLLTILCMDYEIQEKVTKSSWERARDIYRVNSDLDDLEKQREAEVALYSYASKYWSYHLRSGKNIVFDSIRLYFSLRPRALRVVHDPSKVETVNTYDTFELRDLASDWQDWIDLSLAILCRLRQMAKLLASNGTLFNCRNDWLGNRTMVSWLVEVIGRNRSPEYAVGIHNHVRSLQLFAQCLFEDDTISTRVLEYDGSMSCLLLPFCSNTIIKGLLNHGFNMNEWYFLQQHSMESISAEFYKGIDCSAFSVAIRLRHWNVVEFLMQHGADLENWPKEQPGPLWLLFLSGSRYWSTPDGTPSGRQVASMPPECLPISQRMLGAGKGHAERLPATVRYGDLNAYQSKVSAGDCLLHANASCADVEFTSKLLASNAYVNALDARGLTPLTRLLESFCGTNDAQHNCKYYVDRVWATAQALLRYGGYLVNFAVCCERERKERRACIGQYLIDIVGFAVESKQRNLDNRSKQFEDFFNHWNMAKRVDVEYDIDTLNIWSPPEEYQFQHCNQKHEYSESGIGDQTQVADIGAKRIKSR